MKLRKKDTPKPMVELMSTSLSTATNQPMIRTTSSTFSKVADALSRILLPLLLVLSVLLVLVLLPVKASALELPQSSVNFNDSFTIRNVTYSGSTIVAESDLFVYPSRSWYSRTGSTAFDVSTLPVPNEDFLEYIVRIPSSAVGNRDIITFGATYYAYAEIGGALNGEYADALLYSLPYLEFYDQLPPETDLYVTVDVCGVNPQTSRDIEWTSYTATFPDFGTAGFSYFEEDLYLAVLDSAIARDWNDSTIYAFSNLTFEFVYPIGSSRSYLMQFPTVDFMESYLAGSVGAPFYDLGYEEGEDDGYNEGIADAVEVGSVEWLLGILDSVLEFPVIRTSYARIKIGDILAVVVAVPLVRWFLKLFAGG